MLVCMYYMLTVKRSEGCIWGCLASVSPKTPSPKLLASL